MFTEVTEDHAIVIKALINKNTKLKVGCSFPSLYIKLYMVNDLTD